jgi:Cu/Ag efflux protein CusF
MSKTSTILAGLAWLASAALLSGQQPAAPQAKQNPDAVTKVNSVSATATIMAIDSTSRMLTLKNEKGEEDTFAVGPAVTRFNELKVGDKVKMTYYESLVFQVLKPGETSTAANEKAAFTRATGALPGGSVATQMKKTVTVKSIDPALPSITVTTEDGRTVTRKIEDRKNLEKVKVGDRIDITYTEALLVNIERVQ